jgi:hypothetical protein
MKKLMIASGFFMLLNACVWAQEYQNLILNPSAQSLSLENWQIVYNGGDGWTVFGNSGVDNTPCFATSYDWDVKSQTIDLLARGYSTALLDNAPIVLFSDRYVGEGNGSTYADDYELTVELRDGSGGVLASFSSGNLTCTDQWQTIKGSFRNYGPGLRYIYFEHAGKDNGWWSGYYGAKMDDAWLSIVNNIYYSDAETMSLSGWEVTSNEGDGWLVDGCFRTSYGANTKHQLIDLVGLGYTPEELDSQPFIHAGEWSVGYYPNYADYYWLTLRLLNENMETIGEYLLNTTTTTEWIWHGADFENYGTGLRYIYFEHGGTDCEYWLGHYGAMIDNSFVDITLDNATGTGSKQSETGMELAVFPNPARDHFTIKFTQYQRSAVNLFITDVTGNVVYQEYLGDISEQVYYKKMVMNSLAKGTYFITIDRGMSRHTTQLVIR